MNAPLWFLAGLGVVAALWLATRLPRERRPAAAVLAVAAGLAALRLFALAVPVAAVGIGMWRRAAPIAGPRSSGRSSVESAGLRMTLDHASGDLDGEVTDGPLAGRLLSTLSTAELESLRESFSQAKDDESLALLLAWLDRYRTEQARREEPREAPAKDGRMTEAEAYRILGLQPGASLDEVRAAYRRLIRRVHPDLGGSSALTATLNAAKEVLDPG